MRAADVRADRAAGSARVELVVGEVVRAGEARVVGVGRERERRAARPASDHLRGEPEPRLRVARSVGAPRHAVDVSARTRARPAAAGGRRGSCRCGRGRRGRSPPRRGAASLRVGRGVEQRPARVQAVLVRVAEEELPGADGRLRRARLREALDERLRDPVAEAERLEVVEIRRAQAVAQREPPGREPASLLRPRAAAGRRRPARREGGRCRSAGRSGPPTPTARARSRRGRPGCASGARVVIPATNSFENIASAASGSPSCARPELVKARLSARSSGRASELVIAPAVSPSQRRAAAASSIPSSRKAAALRSPYPRANSPWMSARSSVTATAPTSTRRRRAGRRGCARSAGC